MFLKAPTAWNAVKGAQANLICGKRMNSESKVFHSTGKRFSTWHQSCAPSSNQVEVLNESWLLIECNKSFSWKWRDFQRRFWSRYFESNYFCIIRIIFILPSLLYHIIPFQQKYRTSCHHATMIAKCFSSIKTRFISQCCFLPRIDFDERSPPQVARELSYSHSFTQFQLQSTHWIAA